MTLYTGKIRAGSATGAPTDWTQEATGTPHKKATAPSNVTVTTGDGTLTVSWGASTAGSYPITGYTVALVWGDGVSFGGYSEFCETGPTVLTCTAPAQPGVTHNVRVQAVDSGHRTGEYAEVTSGVVPFSSSVPASDGDLTLPAGSTASVPAGKTITVSGSGYAPGSTVTVLIYSEPQVLTTVIADENGAFTVTVTVPAGLAPGQHTLVASGVDSEGNPRYVTLPVTVVAGLASTGADIAVPVIGGLAALTVGGTLLLVSRRRKAA
jgi:titin